VIIILEKNLALLNGISVVRYLSGIRKGKIMSNIHNDAIKEMLYEAALTSLIEGGKPDNEETAIEAVKIVNREFEEREGY
jgi:hypothetical protein